MIMKARLLVRKKKKNLQVNGESKRECCIIGLESEVSVWTPGFNIHGNRYGYICMYRLKYIHIFLALPLRVPRNNENPVAKRTLRPKILVS